jgi:hypothetical protein
MRSNGPLANKEVAMGGHGWPHGWPWVARWPAGQPPIYSKRYIYIYRNGRQRWPFLRSGRKWPFGPPHEPPRRSGRDCRRSSNRAVGYRSRASRRSVPVGDSSTPESRTLTPVNHGSNPGPSASYYVLDIAYVIVFPGSLFSREFAGVTGLVFKAIRGRDGFTRDFGWTVMKISPAPFRG